MASAVLEFLFDKRMNITDMRNQLPFIVVFQH
jgi:hypothetical protein